MASLNASSHSKDKSAAKRTKAAFYNVENLFDTILNPMINDGKFTPTGAYGWTAGRYKTKIESIARVLDDLNADFVGLCEVENEQVVRDLVCATVRDYAYVHRNSYNGRGIDLAVIYRPERLFIDSVKWHKIEGFSREVLTLFGEIDDHNITVLFCHLPSELNSSKLSTRTTKELSRYIEKLILEHPQSKIMVMGDLNFSFDDPRMSLLTKGSGHRLTCLSGDNLCREGKFTYIYNDKRLIYDHILVGNIDPSRCSAEVFARDYLFMSDQYGVKSILPTFRRGTYKGGASDHLPIVLSIDW